MAFGVAAVTAMRPCRCWGTLRHACYCCCAHARCVQAVRGEVTRARRPHGIGGGGIVPSRPAARCQRATDSGVVASPGARKCIIMRGCWNGHGSTGAG